MEGIILEATGLLFPWKVFEQLTPKSSRDLDISFKIIWEPAPIPTVGMGGTSPKLQVVQELCGEDVPRCSS
jgi:hypothetical protein